MFGAYVETLRELPAKQAALAVCEVDKAEATGADLGDSVQIRPNRQTSFAVSITSRNLAHCASTAISLQ